MSWVNVNAGIFRAFLQFGVRGRTGFEPMTTTVVGPYKKSWLLRSVE